MVLVQTDVVWDMVPQLASRRTLPKYKVGDLAYMYAAQREGLQVQFIART